MSLEDRLAQPQTASPASRRSRPAHPDGWQPGIDTAAGVVTTQSDSPDGPDWSHVLEQLGLDPADWSVVDDRAEIRSWDVAAKDGTTRCWYHKAKVQPRRDRDTFDIEQLAAQIRRRGPLKNATKPPTVSGGWLVVVLTDWQAGKGTKGGVQQLVDRLERVATEVEQRRRELAAAGRDVQNLAILLGGDLVEGCTGHYAMQTFEVQLHMRDQVKLVRRSLVELVDVWASRFQRITVAAAAGNHGEKRQGSKAYTAWADNYDVEVVEQAAEIWAANPGRFGHVGVLLPEPEDLTVTVELDGLRVAVAHGHQASRGAGVQKRVLGWWDRMAATRHPVGDADVLVTGHYHHLELHVDGTADGGTRTWMQAPAFDGGSPWWEQQGGGYTAAGTLTFVASGGRWSDLHVIPADGPQDDG